MPFIPSLLNAKVWFYFPSKVVIKDVVIRDWSSPRWYSPSLLFTSERKGEWHWVPHGDLYLWPSFSWGFPRQNCRKLSRNLSFPLSRRAYLVQVDHIKEKTQMQTFWLFCDSQACSYIFLLFKKYVHLISCAPLQNILFSWQMGHVLVLRHCTEKMLRLLFFGFVFFFNFNGMETNEEPTVVLAQSMLSVTLKGLHILQELLLVCT